MTTTRLSDVQRESSRAINERLMKRYGIDHNEYCRVHSWVHRNYGSATKCEGKECMRISKQYQWALIKGKKYEEKRENFIQLCRSCHSKMDMTEEGRQSLRKHNLGKKLAKHSKIKVSKAFGGERCHFHVLKNNDVFKIRKLRKSGKYTYVQLGKIFGVSYPTIGRLLQGKTWKYI